MCKEIIYRKIIFSKKCLHVYLNETLKHVST